MMIGIGLAVSADATDDSAQAAMLARDKGLELDTPYVPPPGDPRLYHAAGFAQVMCSAVFITGLTLDFAAENVGYFTAPYAERKKLGAPQLDRAASTVSVAIPDGPVRTAKYVGGQGCVTYPVGEHSLHFTPRRIVPALPPADAMDWPMGDRIQSAQAPTGIDGVAVERAVDAAFGDGQSMTAAFVVTWKGRIIGERYAPGITATTPLESWSMGKSVTATLLGILIREGVYTLTQAAPVPEWQASRDPRARIRIEELLQMSSGLRIRAPFDPDYDPKGPYPDHLYLYTGAFNSFHYAATRPLEWPPGTVGRYRNTDPVLVNYLIRLAVERRQGDYLGFPQRELFDKIGVRSMVIETDPYGDFLTQGYDLAAARDWARLGNLYLQDGVWNGTRLLPEGYVHFVSSLAPAWVADGRPIYGGFFWINGDGAFPVPKDAYYMSGAGGQYTLIIPSHDLVVVRLGHFKGERHADDDLSQALMLLMRAVPAHLTTTKSAN